MSSLNRFFDLVFLPFDWMSREVALLIAAVLFGILLVPVYGKVSPQATIAKAKKRIFAALYESVIFRRNTGLSLKAQGRMFINGLIYFLVAIPPILVLAIPCVLVLAQCNLFFGVNGVKPGEPFLVIAHLASPSQVKSTTIEAGAPLDISQPVRAPDLGELSWRLTVPRDVLSGKSGVVVPLTLRSGGESVTLDLKVGENSGKTYPLYTNALSSQLLYPSGMVNPPWLTELEVRYPERVFSYGLFSSDWFVLFLLVSIASGYAASKVFGVEV